MAYNADQITANAFAVTPSDSTKLGAFGFYVGGYATGTTPGDVAVITEAGETAATPTAVVFKNVPPGTQIRLCVSRIMATGTTATSIVAFGPT